MRIYFDVCCLHRPFDDQIQERIRLESEAVQLVLQLCGAGTHHWISSDVVENEVERNPNGYTRTAVQAMLRCADERLTLTDAAVSRARTHAQMGIPAVDALHLAVAEEFACDVFLTTDDQLCRRVRARQPALLIKVDNPVAWLLEVTRDET